MSVQVTSSAPRSFGTVDFKGFLCCNVRIFWMSAIVKFWQDGYFGHPVFYCKETALTGVEQLFGRRVET